MKQFKVLWTRSDYGTIVIEAEDATQAEELFALGEWNEEDLNIKNGGMECEKVEELEDITK